SVASSLPRGSVGFQAIAESRALAVTDYANDPHGAAVRDAIVREGFDSMAVAPLVADGEILGLLSVYHDTRHPWTNEDLQLLDSLGAQAGVAIKNARNYEKMA